MKLSKDRGAKGLACLYLVIMRQAIMRRLYIIEYGSQPFTRFIQRVNIIYLHGDYKQEEPYEGRLSRTVLWERRGATPLRDPTMRHQWRQC
jgi:hypothetical protein